MPYASHRFVYRRFSLSPLRHAFLGTPFRLISRLLKPSSAFRIFDMFFPPMADRQWVQSIATRVSLHRPSSDALAFFSSTAARPLIFPDYRPPLYLAPPPSFGLIT